jgi:hypothetical protein
MGLEDGGTAEIWAVGFAGLLHGLGGWRRIDCGKEGLKAALRDHVALKIVVSNRQIYLAKRAYLEQGVKLFVLQCFGKRIGKCFPGPRKKDCENYSL